MGNLGMTIDPNAIPPDSGTFDLIPAGTIAMAQIVASKVEPTKDQSGTRAELEWEILDGPYKGRKVWDGINIRLPNSPKAQEIGQRHLSAVAVATVGRPVSNTDEVHFKPCMVKIGIDKGKDGYADKNKISGVKALGAVAPGTPAGSPPAAAAPQTWQTPPARPATPQPGGVPWGAMNPGAAVQTAAQTF